jgi:4-aminobutyrate aminotransferase / (S)-3-amino-2-methylpropionate transaminase / 5-aminovalerate transaminase
MAASGEMSFTQSLPEIRVPPPGPASRTLAARLAALESPAVDARREDRQRESGEEQAPIVYARGQGPNVIDVDGNRYVDLAAGFGALLLGHVPPRVAAALAEQESRLWLALGDVYAAEAKVALCERLVQFHPEPGARVMLGASGADALTAALKTAMLATRRPGVLAFEGAYHGLSHGPLAACGLRPSFREPFAEQLNGHVMFAPYPGEAREPRAPGTLGDAASLEASRKASLDATMTAVNRALAAGTIGAVLVEPILGRGGCIVPPGGFLPALREACDRHGALLVCDEIWTGLGRSGAWLASAEAGVVPDLLCLGKGLGGGLPISACIGRGSVMAAWGAHGGTTIHTATHFGAPPACSAALATLAVLAEEGLPARARDVGARWAEGLRGGLQGCGVTEVRGRGLMIGVALEGGAARALTVTRRLLQRGWIVLTGGVAGDVLTLTPPLDIDERLLDAFTVALAAATRGA